MGHYPFVIRCPDMQMYVGIELQNGAGLVSRLSVAHKAQTGPWDFGNLCTESSTHPSPFNCQKCLLNFVAGFLLLPSHLLSRRSCNENFCSK